MEVHIFTPSKMDFNLSRCAEALRMQREGERGEGRVEIAAEAECHIHSFDQFPGLTKLVLQNRIYGHHRCFVIVSSLPG